MELKGLVEFRGQRSERINWLERGNFLMGRVWEGRVKSYFLLLCIQSKEKILTQRLELSSDWWWHESQTQELLTAGAPVSQKGTVDFYPFPFFFWHFANFIPAVRAPLVQKSWIAPRMFAGFCPGPAESQRFALPFSWRAQQQLHPGIVLMHIEHMQQLHTFYFNSLPSKCGTGNISVW